MLNEKVIKALIGNIGEELVAEYYGVERNSDWFDDKADLYLNDKSIEVKTCTMLLNKSEFLIDISQLNKVRNVDILNIVSIPIYNNVCEVYNCPNNSNLRPVTRISYQQPKETLAIPLNRLEKLTEYSDERVLLLIDLADMLSPFRRDKRKVNDEEVAKRISDRLRRMYRVTAEEKPRLPV